VDFSAGKLFMQTAQRQRPDFDLVGSDYEDLARICQLVEGMPLALELAAIWTEALPLSDIAAQIQRNFGFLTTEFQDMPSRHRSVRAVIDVSWEQLLPAEQVLFSQLSVFRGGFTREAAMSITGATMENISSLVGKSLLRYVKSQDRYYIHELLRQYGEEKIALHAEGMEELHDHHSQYFCRWFADQCTPEVMKSVGQKAVLDAMTADLENVREAWIWALQNQHINRLIFRATAFGMYYVWRGGYKEGERSFRAFNDLLSDGDKTTDASRVLLKASILTWLAFFLYQVGERSRAIDSLIQSQGLLNSPNLEEMDTRAERAHNLINLARSDWHQSDEVRLAQAAQARVLHREVGHPFGLPFTLGSSARLAILTSNLDEAQTFLEESLEIYESTGNQIGLSIALTGLGNLAFAQNNYTKSERLLAQSLEIAREMGSIERIIVASLYMGIAQLHSGQFRAASRILETCVTDSADQGLKAWQATSLYYLGYTLLHLGEYDQAVECGRAALPLAEQTNDIEFVSLAMMLPAAAAQANGDFTKALHGFDKAAQVEGLIRFGWVVGGEDPGLIGRGTALLQLGSTEEAQNIFTNLLQQAVDTHRQDRLLYALVGFALLLAHQGEAERATELYSLAASHPFVGESRWFWDTFGQHIQAASKDIPSAEIEVARVRGQSLDLWETAKELLLEYCELSS
jgi:tetratricopeptide (TPR) repeat protein